jgi:hypothetical protein
MAVFRDLPAPLENTEPRPSTAWRFQALTWFGRTLPFSRNIL